MTLHDWPVLATAALALAYFLKQSLQPASATRAHDRLRQDWMQAVSAHKGTEVLAVQTIRNSLMSCTMTATTATLAFMGGVTLLHNGWPTGLPLEWRVPDAGQLLFWNALLVLVMLALAFMASMLAARYWHHAGFVAGMPTESAERQRWQAHGVRCLTRAGRYYALALRLMMWTVPVLFAGVLPLGGLLAGCVLLAVLWLQVDRQVL